MRLSCTFGILTNLKRRKSTERSRYGGPKTRAATGRGLSLTLQSRSGIEQGPDRMQQKLRPLILENPTVHHPHRFVRQLREPGQNNHWNRWIDALELACGGDSVLAGHPIIEQHQFERLGLKSLDALVAGTRDHHLMTCGFQDALANVKRGRFVVNAKYLRHVCRAACK